MALEIDEIKFKIGADNSALNKALDESKANAEKIGSTISSKAGSIASAMSTLADSTTSTWDKIKGFLGEYGGWIGSAALAVVGAVEVMISVFAKSKKAEKEAIEANYEERKKKLDDITKEGIAYKNISNSIDELKKKNLSAIDTEEELLKIKEELVQSTNGQIKAYELEAMTIDEVNQKIKETIFARKIEIANQKVQADESAKNLRGQLAETNTALSGMLDSYDEANERLKIARRENNLESINQAKIDIQNATRSLLSTAGESGLFGMGGQAAQMRVLMYTKAMSDARAAELALEKLAMPGTKTVKTTGTKEEIVKDNDYLLSEIQKRLKAELKLYEEYLKSKDADDEAGNAKYLEKISIIAKESEKLLSESVLSESQKKYRAIDEEKEKRINAAKELYEIELTLLNKNLDKIISTEESKNAIKEENRIKAQENLNKKLSEIDLSYSKKVNNQKLADDAEYAQKAAQIMSGVKSFVGATSAGGAISSIGGIASAFNPAMGSIISAGGQIISVFEEVFTNSKNIAEQEKIRSETLDKQNKLLEQQVRQAELLRQVELDKLKLSDANIDREIKLHALTITDQEERRKADLETYEKQKQLILSTLAGYGIKETSVGEITGIISNVEKSKLATDAAAKLASDIIAGATKDNALEIAAQLNAINLKDVDRELVGIIHTAANKFSQVRTVKVTVGGLFGSTTKETTNFGELTAGISPALSNVISMVSSTQTGIIDRSNALLKVTEDIANSSKGTLDNTTQIADNTVSLRTARESSFIDIFRGTINSIGQMINPSVSPMALPGQLGGMSLATAAVQSVEERMASGIYSLIDIQKEARALLEIIAQKTGGMTESQFLTLWANVKARGLN